MSRRKAVPMTIERARHGINQAEQTMYQVAREGYLMGLEHWKDYEYYQAKAERDQLATWLDQEWDRQQ